MTAQFANVKYNDFLSSVRRVEGSTGQHLLSLHTGLAVRGALLSTDQVMSGMFQVCQGTCLCAPSPEGYGKGKVLYCYGEVGTSRILTYK